MTSLITLRVRATLFEDRFVDYNEETRDGVPVRRRSGFSVRTKEWMDGVRVIVTHRFGNDDEGRPFNGSRGADDETRNQAIEKMVQSYAGALSDAGFTVENCGTYLVVVQ